jgi:hypothetical protein
MVLTPSTTSGGIAGFSFWGLCWLALAKLDAIAELFHMQNFVSSKYVFRWIMKHKAVALVCTELINFGMHGTEGAGVVFAIGGSICNASVIFGILPLVNKIKGPTWLYGDFRR